MQRSNSIVLCIFSVIALLSSIFLSEASAFEFPPYPSPVEIKEEYVEGQLIVKFKPSVSEADKDKLHKKLESKKIKDFEGVSAQLLELKKGLKVKDAVELYKEDPSVEYAEPNHIYQYFATYPNEQYSPGRFNEQWNLTKIGAPVAWDSTQGNYSVTVAIIDSGIYYSHGDLAANSWKNNPANNPYNDPILWYGRDASATNPGSPATYYNPLDTSAGHGTHVAGIIGAVGNNSTGIAGSNWYIAGLNWYTELMACKAAIADVNQISSCVDHILDKKSRGVNIVAVNASWGGTGYNVTLKSQIKRLSDAGILFVAAAGNAGPESVSTTTQPNNDMKPIYPASYDLPNIISVGSTDINDQRSLWQAWYNSALQNFESCYGRRNVDIAAPGKNVLSTFIPPTTNHSYYDTYTLYPQTPCDNPTGYCYLSGTSMAAPHITGLAGLLKAQNSTRDWAKIKKLILAGGDKISALSGTNLTGRRTNANWSLNCSSQSRPDQTAKYTFSVKRISPLDSYGNPNDQVGPIQPLRINEARSFSVLSINCDASIGPVTASTSTYNTFYLYDNDNDGTFTGTWTPTAIPKWISFSSSAGSETLYLPYISSGVSPSSGSQRALMPLEFTVTYSNLSGAQNISNASFGLIKDANVSFKNSLIALYDNAANKLNIGNEDGTGWATSCTPGSNNPSTIANALGYLDCYGTIITRSGNNLTIKWRIVPYGVFAGTKNIYVNAADANGLDASVIT